jgi:hypothetical protein
MRVQPSWVGPSCTSGHPKHLMICDSYLHFPDTEDNGKICLIFRRCNRPQYVVRLTLNGGGNKTECLQHFCSHTAYSALTCAVLLIDNKCQFVDRLQP